MPTPRSRCSPGAASRRRLWSAGRIGIEMISRYAGLKGLIVTGTPPVGGDQVDDGFLPNPHMHLAGQDVFSDERADSFAHDTCGRNAPFEPFLLAAVQRCDGRAQRLMFKSFVAGVGDNQRAVVETAKLSLANASGGDEPYVNNAYLETVAYANLWKAGCIFSTALAMRRSGKRLRASIQSSRASWATCWCSNLSRRRGGRGSRSALDSRQRAPRRTACASCSRTLVARHWAAHFASAARRRARVHRTCRP